MKSTIFDVRHKSCSHAEQKISDSEYLWEFQIPILPAYAVEYFVVQIGALSCLPDKKDIIKGDKLIFTSGHSIKDDQGIDFDVKITIHYHGIRDYALLFYWVSDQNLKERLGEFYREAELNFESGARLSFMLMSGAIFEGILSAKLNSKNKFVTLINDADSKKIIDTQTKGIIDNVREKRNIIHSSKYQQPYINRAEFMDTRSILDRLIKDI